MKIGLDAKRIFNNATGLGVYGRNLLNGFQQCERKHEYHLFTPQKESPFLNVNSLPTNCFVEKGNFNSSYYWRTWSIYKDIIAKKIDIYHGLSNELPFSINKTKAKKIVDIHDLCFVHFKEDYSKIDQNIFLLKTRFAAKNSDIIIAASEDTKKDILQAFHVPEKKVKVVYQCCDDRFYVRHSAAEIETVKQKYGLPKKYILSVGTIQGRKNQKAIIEAVALLKKEERLPMVLVGNGKDYLQEAKALAVTKGIELRVVHNVSFIDLPVVYQGANLFVFPSFIEGFGIPVLEAMASGVPTITSKQTSMAEIIQDENALINPKDVKELSERIQYFLQSDTSFIVEKNKERAKDFSQRKFASDVLDIYDSF